MLTEAAASANWIQVLVPALVSVVGWIAVYGFNVRAQTRALRLQVVDRARLDVVSELRKYQHWLSALWYPVFSADSGASAFDHGKWERLQTQLSGALDEHRPSQAWQLRLEEYEILFPESRGVRIELGHRSREIVRLAVDASVCLGSMALARADSPNEVQRGLFSAASEAMTNQQALVEDLIVHLQNASLGPITGNRVPLRLPGDPNTERMELNSITKQLVIRRTSSHDPTVMAAFPGQDRKPE